MNNSETIDKAIQIMIASPIRQFTASQLRDVVRSTGRGMSDSQWRECLAELKADTRITVKKAGGRKVYYSYRGSI